jgi:hypothetical protein
MRITNNDEDITCYPVMNSVIHQVGPAFRFSLYEDFGGKSSPMRIQCEACDKEHEVYVDNDVLYWWQMKYNLSVRYNGWA